MRELAYTVPYERLIKLGRSMARKALPWWGTWVFLVSYLVVWGVLSIFIDPIVRWIVRAGVPSEILPDPSLILIGISIVLLMPMLWLISKLRAEEAKAGVNYNQTVHLIRDEGGIRIGTDDIEYYVKWSGISQLLIEPDGVVIAHGGTFWLVPDTAFANPGERLGFIRDVYSQLSDRARTISDSHVKPVLSEGG